MALGQTLRYYRGQFDPERAYQPDNSGGSGIMSMYNPETMNQFIEAVAGRQERFDAAKMAQSQEMARIGELETYDLAELSKRLKSFESGINDLVKTKYNGDYSAAANEIAKQIGTERTNPFYHFNKEKVNMGRAYLDAKMKIGPGFMSSGNPMNVSFEDWQQGKTFEFTPIDSKDITQRAAAFFQNYAKRLMSDSGLVSSPEGQYLINKRQYGFRDEREALAYAEEYGLLDQLKVSMPELAGVENQVAVDAALAQGVVYGIGTTEKQYLADQSYMNAGELAGMRGTDVGSRVAFAGMQKTPVTRDDILSSDAWKNTRDRMVMEEVNKTGIAGVTGYDDAPNSIKRVIKKRLSEIPNDENFATPYYEFNSLYGIESKDRLAINTNIEQTKSFINGIPPGSLVGASDDDSKQLKHLTDFDPGRFAIITTENPVQPLMFYLDLEGTPTEKKGTGTPKPVPITAMIHPQDVNTNLRLFEFISRLPGGDKIISDATNKLVLNNPEGARLVLGIPKTTEGDKVLANYQTQVRALYNK